MVWLWCGKKFQSNFILLMFVSICVCSSKSFCIRHFFLFKLICKQTFTFFPLFGILFEIIGIWRRRRRSRKICVAFPIFILFIRCDWGMMVKNDNGQNLWKAGQFLAHKIWFYLFDLFFVASHRVYFCNFIFIFILVLILFLLSFNCHSIFGSIVASITISSSHTDLLNKTREQVFNILQLYECIFEGLLVKTIK